MLKNLIFLDDLDQLIVFMDKFFIYDIFLILKLCYDGLIVTFPLIDCVSFVFIIDPSHLQVHFESLDVGLKLVNFRFKVSYVLIFFFKAALKLVALSTEALVLVCQFIDIFS